MTLAPRSSAHSAKMKTTMSTWTPLNHPLSNSKVFEERRSLLAKWFDRWSDSQRRAVLQDLVLSCSVDQLMFLSLSVSRRLPLQAADFTCVLPRALCLYLFSFLDPRSLCRCAKVSWHWKSIVELDQLWMPKCVRLGWYINFLPSPFEHGVWKRHYIQMVQELRHALLQNTASQHQLLAPNLSDISGRPEDLSEVDLVSAERPASSSQPLRGTSRKKQLTCPPPWRDSDRNPKDTLRFNYLDNTDPSDQGQMKIQSSTCRANTWKPDVGTKTSLSEANYKLRKAKSLMFLSSNCRPQTPPSHETQTRFLYDHPISNDTSENTLRLAQWNAGIRPGPVRPAIPRLSVEALRASQRSHRSAPSKPLFKAWTAPTSHAQDIR
ncbi:F-box only protein 16 isoform X2 [Cheilinus undulatus]|nr:F-box only protein 16 isoform X2 [Cheilinus undulatus]XP_041662005.1 F-box only protein 16 isoform X2 [Cheilinus undulatus]XP_041662006.1 F-box only protein 16 isoform X2 [Cheilinus undulatus]